MADSTFADTFTTKFFTTDPDASYSSVTYFESTTFLNNDTITNTAQKAQISLYGLLIPILGFIVIILNLAVVISSGLILKKGSQPRATYLFLGNVAMSDLTTAIAILLGNFYPKDSRTQFTCAFSLGLIVSSTVVSIYSVGLIALDRYLYIIHGLQYQRWVYPMRARMAIGVTWVIGCIVGFLPIMGWAGDTFNGKYCWFIRLVPPKLIVMTCIVGLIPIILVVVLYSIILYHAIKKVIQLKNAGKGQVKNENDLRIFRGKNTAAKETEENINEPEKNFFKRIFKKSDKPKPETNSPSKSRAVKIVLFTTGSFVITWVPYFVASFMYVSCDETLTPHKCKSLRVLIASPLAILGFFNSVLNPIIYAWWHRGFRDFVKKCLCKNKISKRVGIASTSNEKSTTSGRKTSDTKLSNVEVQMENVQLHQ